jgi:hypothetical protein
MEQCTRHTKSNDILYRYVVAAHFTIFLKVVVVCFFLQIIKEHTKESLWLHFFFFSSFFIIIYLYAKWNPIEAQNKSSETEIVSTFFCCSLASFFCQRNLKIRYHLLPTVTWATAQWHYLEPEIPDKYKNKQNTHTQKDRDLWGLAFARLSNNVIHNCFTTQKNVIFFFSRINFDRLSFNISQFVLLLYVFLRFSFFLFFN